MSNQAEFFQPVQVLSEERVLVDWGPMTMSVSAWDQGRARPVIAAMAAHRALACLNTLAEYQKFLRHPTANLPSIPQLPGVVQRAFTAARSVSGELTSFAAVAGATADHVADAAAQSGANKIIVNNGGDVALRLGPGETAVVGIKPHGTDSLIARLHLTHRLGIGGIASSGWAGRSHCPGVADLVTVWARDAALADAAATFIASRTSTDGDNVTRLCARDLDPLTDLDATPVTTNVGQLTRAQRTGAMSNGIKAASDLYKNGRIRGYRIMLQGNAVWFDPEGVVSTFS